MPNENEYFGGSINPVGGFGLNGAVSVGNIGINPVGAFNTQTAFGGFGTAGSGGDTSLPTSTTTSTTLDSQSGATTTTSSGTTTPGLFGGGGDTGSGGTNGGATSSTANFTPNALASFAQVAYHFKLLTRGDGLGGGGGQNIVIAESGVTGYNIRDVVFDSIVAPNSRTKNVNMLTCKITVVEPMGSSFLDGLYEAVAKQTGAKNWQQCPYILELSFLGYDESGAQRQITNLPNSGKWSWQLVINNIDVHLETAGGVFTLECVLFHDVAAKPEWMNTQEKYNIEAKTVGEMFTKLAEKLNKMSIKNYETDLVTYVFQFHPGDGAPAADKFKLQDEQSKEKDPNFLWSMKEGTRDTPTYNITRGVQLSDLIESVIQSTREGQELAIYGKSQGGALVKDINKYPDGAEFRDTVLYRVYPQVKYTDYHEPSGNYKRTVIFHVKPYRTQATTVNTQETVKHSEKALQAALPRTKKRYEYIYTGLNTEVLNFDIKFNVLWQGLLPRLRGGNYYNETAVHHARWDPDRKNNDHLGGTNTQSARAATSANSNATNLLGNAGAMGLRDSAQQGLQQQQTQAIETLAIQDQTATALNTAQQELNNGLPKTEAERTALFQKIAALRNTLDSTSNALARDAGSGFMDSSTKYAEEFSEDSAGAYTQISMIQNAEGARRNAGSGVVSDRSRNRSIVGALLNQVYDPTALLKIDIEIMGDPFWLGGPAESNFGQSQGSGDVPNFSDGDTCFCLYFRYPFNMGDSGQPTFRDQDIFNGLYRAITIKHSFSGGKFTQTISANRMEKIHPKDVKKLAESSGGSTGGATPGTTTGTGGTA